MFFSFFPFIILWFEIRFWTTSMCLAMHMSAFCFFLTSSTLFLGGMCLLRNISWFNGIRFFYTFVYVKCTPSTICHKTNFESGDSSRNKLSSTSHSATS